MSVGTAECTVSDLLEMPDDGIQRWLIRGELREGAMTQRNRFHSKSGARFAQLIGEWLDLQPEPRGEIHSGEAGVILSRDPDTSVGIDVVYVSHQAESHSTDETTMLEGAPILAVEISSPSTKEEETNERIDVLLAAGTSAVWVVDPYFQTITVYRADRSTRMYSGDDSIASQEYLPGFQSPVARFFKR